jgi:hypothetical protein
VYSEGNGEYKHLKYFILFANENPAGEDYLDLLKRACHREIIYEAKSSDFGPALKVNLAAWQLCSAWSYAQFRNSFLIMSAP